MNKPSLASLFSVPLVLNTFLMRPAALGQQYVSVAMILAVVLVGGYLAARLNTGRVIRPTTRRDIVFVVLVVTVYWVYEFPLGITQGSDDINLAKDFLSSFIIAFSYAAFLIEERANETFFRIFTTVVGLLGWSSIVTFSLSQIVDLDHLFLFPVNVKGYDAAVTAATGGDQEMTGAVYFPFSMLYSVYTSGTLELNRYSNFFREAGIYQAVSIFCFAYERFTRRSKFISIGLIAGAVASLSTLGLVLLPVTAGLVYVSRRRVSIVRLVLLGFFTVVAAVALIFTPAVGLADKLDTHGTSVTDRSDAINRGIEAIVTNPLGTGLFSERQAGDSICLVAAIAAIGVVGFALQAVLLCGIRPGASAINPKVVVCIPLLVTALFSQPIAGSGMTYVLTMVAVSTVTRRSSMTIVPSRVQHAVGEPGAANR